MENAASNFKFLCDRCTANIGNTANVNINISSLSRNVKALSSELTEMKSTMSVMQKSVHDVVVNMPPPKSFEIMFDNLKDVRTTTESSANIVKEIQSTIQSSPMTCGNDIVELLRGIKDTLALNSISAATTENNKQIVDMLTEIRSNTSTTSIDNFPPLYSNITMRKRKQTDQSSPAPPAKRVQAIEGTGPTTGEFVFGSRTKYGNDENSLVISPLHPSTTADQIKSFVYNKLNLAVDNNEVAITSLAPRGRPLSELNFISFKVSSVDTLRSQISAPEF